MNHRRLFFWLIVAVAAAIVVVFAFHFDEPTRQFLLQHQSRGLRNFMRYASRFGDWPEHLALGFVLLAFAWWRGSKKWTRVFLAMLLALALAGLAARVIKISTGRARPSVKTEQIWNGPKLTSKYNAFPSGHVAASSAFFGVLFLVGWRIGLACLIIPILIGFSRMYVAAHYLSDVLCAGILGILSAMLVAWLVLPRIKTRKS